MSLNGKIELEIGTSQTVAFAYNQGRLCSKRWPGAEDCYARQTIDGRMLFVDAAEEMRLRKAVRVGQPVILCREKTKAGAQYLTIKTPAPELKGPLAVVNGRTLPDTKYAKPELLAPAFPECETPATSTAKTEQPTAAPSVAGDGDLLGRCLCEALNACKVAHAHATNVGLPVAFGPGEIERMAVSIFIERTRYGSVAERKPNGQAGYVNGAAATGA
jgi:hypothetical protein